MAHVFIVHRRHIVTHREAAIFAHRPRGGDGLNEAPVAFSSIYSDTCEEKCCGHFWWRGGSSLRDSPSWSLPFLILMLLSRDAGSCTLVSAIRGGDGAESAGTAGGEGEEDTGRSAEEVRTLVVTRGWRGSIWKRKNIPWGPDPPGRDTWETDLQGLRRAERCRVWRLRWLRRWGWGCTLRHLEDQRAEHKTSVAE